MSHKLKTFIALLLVGFVCFSAGRADSYVAKLPPSYLPALGEDATIGTVNDFVNSFPYKSDIELYGRDYTATPKEFFENNGGDCEDYALAKAALLVGLDIVDESKLELWLLVKGNKNFHAVLAINQGAGKYLILDNANKNMVQINKSSLTVGKYLILRTFKLNYARDLAQ